MYVHDRLVLGSLAGRLTTAALLVVLMWARPVAGQTDLGNCGALQNAYGPYDYRTDRDKLPIVDGAHFTPEVEALVRGATGNIGGDLDYTLRAFPNHHRALIAMMRLGERLKSPRAPGAKFDVECYFVRGVAFRANDAIVRMLYATYLNGNRRKADALQQLSAAQKLAGDNPFTHHNLGLIYMDLGEPELALKQAHAALALGVTRTELKERLVSAGKWAEPAPANPVSGAGGATQPPANGATRPADSPPAMQAPAASSPAS